MLFFIKNVNNVIFYKKLNPIYYFLIYTIFMMTHNNNNNNNKRKRIRWNENEDTLLREYYRDSSLDVIQIGSLMKRSPGGIMSRLERLNIIPHKAAARGYKDAKKLMKDNNDSNSDSNSSLIEELLLHTSKINDEYHSLIVYYDKLKNLFDIVDDRMKLLYDVGYSIMDILREDLGENLNTRKRRNSF